VTQPQRCNPDPLEHFVTRYGAELREEAETFLYFPAELAELAARMGRRGLRFVNRGLIGGVLVIDLVRLDGTPL